MGGHCERSSATRKPPTMLVLFEILFFSLESNPGPRSHIANCGTPAVTTRPSRSPMTTSVYRALPPLSSDKVMASIWRFFHCLWQRSCDLFSIKSLPPSFAAITWRCLSQSSGLVGEWARVCTQLPTLNLNRVCCFVFTSV